MTLPTDSYSSKAIETIVSEIAKDLYGAAKGALHGAFELTRWLFAAQEYARHLQERYGTMRVLGKPHPISLEGVYTEIYVLDKPTAFRRHNVDELHVLQKEENKFGYGKLERQHAETFLREQKSAKLFVLGKPGAGKTTFLKALTMRAAAGKIKKMPIFVSLYEWAEKKQSLLDYIESQFAICQFPAARPFIELALQQGQALVLFDGLDEVNEADEQRGQTVRQLRDFTDQYPKNSIVITCRVAASNYELSDRFNYVEVADFTDKQVTMFARKWFTGDAKKRNGFLAELEKNENRGVRELTNSPLLLTLLCLTYDETMTFPARRAEIYEEAIDALLKKWDAARSIKRDEIYKGLSLGRKRQLLAELAASYFEQGQIFFRATDIGQRVENFLERLSSSEGGTNPEGQDIVRAIAAQHGLLVERARQIYSFSHLTLQEYFTARYITENNTWQGLIRYCADPRWREVFLLTASMLSDGAAFLGAFRQALDASLTTDLRYTQYLQWASSKASDYKTIPHFAVARAAALAITHNLAFGLDLALNLALALDRNLDRDLAHRLPLDIDINLDRDLVHNRVGGRALKINQSANRALTQAIQALKVPKMNAGTHSWKEYNSRIREITVQYRNIGHDWQWTQADKKVLDDYNNATILLAQCLSLASVDKATRKKIEESLFLPPGEWDI